MQAQHGLLIFRLRRYRAHSGCCTAVQIARASAASVLFVCTKGRMNFAWRSTTSCPSALILRAHQCALPQASNATAARRSLRQESNQFVAAKPSIHDLARFNFDPKHLEHALRNIQSIRRSIHLGPSVPQVVSVETPLWHVDAVRSGGSLRPLALHPETRAVSIPSRSKADDGPRAAIGQLRTLAE